MQQMLNFGYFWVHTFSCSRNQIFGMKSIPYLLVDLLKDLVFMKQPLLYFLKTKITL
jgi:hypothetical protein